MKKISLFTTIAFFAIIALGFFTITTPANAGWKDIPVIGAGATIARTIFHTGETTFQIVKGNKPLDEFGDTTRGVVEFVENIIPNTLGIDTGPINEITKINTYVEAKGHFPLRLARDIGITWCAGAVIGGLSGSTWVSSKQAGIWAGAATGAVTTENYIREEWNGNH